MLIVTPLIIRHHLEVWLGRSLSLAEPHVELSTADSICTALRRLFELGGVAEPSKMIEHVGLMDDPKYAQVTLRGDDGQIALACRLLQEIDEPQ